MNLVCRSRDIAIVIRDLPGCEGNVGRLVQVLHFRVGLEWEPGAPVAPYWQIQQLNTDTPWYVRERDGSITREIVTAASRVIHLDGWLLPIWSEQSQAMDAANKDKVWQTPAPENCLE